MRRGSALPNHQTLRFVLHCPTLTSPPYTRETMPYRLVQFPDGYRVMTEDTGEFHSTDALPLARAKRQMTALNLALAREKGYDVPPPPKAKGGAKTYRQKFLDRYELPDRSYSLEEVSKITSVPMDILQEVYNRGIGAYKTNPQSVRLKGSFVKNVDAPLSKKLSKEQWAMARVMSFVMGNPKHDNDLRANKVRGGIGMEEEMRKMADKYPRVLPRIHKELYDNALVALSQLRRSNFRKFIDGVLGTLATAGAVTTTAMVSSLNPFAIAVGVPTYALFRFIKDAEKDRDALKRRVITTLKGYYERLSAVPQDEQPRVYQDILLEMGRAPPRRAPQSAVRDVFAPPPPPPREEAPPQYPPPPRSAVRDVLPPPPPPREEAPPRERIAFEPVQARGSVGPSVREIARALNVEGRPLEEALEGRRGKGKLLSTPLPAVPPPKDDAYLTLARKKARDAGIEGRITYAPKPHKLQIETPDGRVVKFGRQGYGDHLLWSRAEAEGKVPKGTADTKRRQYRARATRIKGDWKKDKYSPNNLAINILW